MAKLRSQALAAAALLALLALTAVVIASVPRRVGRTALLSQARQARVQQLAGPNEVREPELVQGGGFPPVCGASPRPSAARAARRLPAVRRLPAARWLRAAPRCMDGAWVLRCHAPGGWLPRQRAAVHGMRACV